MSTQIHRFNYTQRLSVVELEQYWDTFDKLVVGEGLETLPLRLLPPWEDICRKLGWHSYRVQGGYFTKKDYAHSGVYRLIGLAADDDVTQAATLNRVCGQDPTGTLYIGHAGRLNERLNQLRRTLLSRHENSHGAIGALLSVTELASRFPPNRLAISLLDTGIRPRFVEGTLIRAYRNTFGDNPPLNFGAQS
jgi:hypothetical protein